jgi:hypothetical protein
MRTTLPWVALSLAIAASPAAAAKVTDALAARLAEEFRPAVVTSAFECGDDLDLLGDPLSQMQGHNLDGFGFAFNMGYDELHFPGDSRTYVMLVWKSRDFEVYWVLLSSADLEHWELVQQSGTFLLLACSGTPWTSLADLENDGKAEVLLQCGGGAIEVLFVYRWQDSKLTPMAPMEHSPLPFCSGLALELPVITSGNNSIVLQDLDGDGKAEIIAYPDLANERVIAEDTGEPEIRPEAQNGTRVFQLDNGHYKLWKEVPANQEFPITVPGIASIHPGTLTLSELRSNGGGQLRVFVGHPAGTATVDDFVVGSFVFDPSRSPIEFKKRWDNQRYPDLSQGNQEWQGCPVRQERRASQGQWSVNPSQPSYPSPSADWEYYFLGPYIEFRLDRKVVFPYLLGQATRYFQEHQNATEGYFELPLTARMSGERLASIGAIVCVKTTGNAK